MSSNKQDTPHLIINVFGWIACTIVIFFFFTLWLFSYNNIDEPLKDAWSISAAVLAALTTLGAAYIATQLFNDWREQHNKTIEKEMALAAIHKFDAADLHLAQFIDAFDNFEYKCQFPGEMSDTEFLNLDNELNNLLASIGGAALDFKSFLESVRKYCLIVEKPYYDDIKSDVQHINVLIFNTKNHRALFPNSMNAIKDVNDKLRNHINDIETKCIDNILSELKALS